MIIRNTYNDIIDNVEKQLLGWNASYLSLAGIITLTQFVLQANHYMPCKRRRLQSGLIIISIRSVRDLSKVGQMIVER